MSLSACELRLHPAVKDVLKCYISGHPLPNGNDVGLASFAIPDLGILFRSLAEGSRTDLELISLFSLLRFAAHNKEIFLPRKLLVLTDYQLLALLMDRKRAASKNLGSLRKEAKKIAGEIGFTVKAIPGHENRASGPVGEIPVLPANATLEIKSFSSLTMQKPLDPLSFELLGKSR